MDDVSHDRGQNPEKGSRDSGQLLWRWSLSCLAGFMLISGTLTPAHAASATSTSEDALGPLRLMVVGDSNIVGRFGRVFLQELNRTGYFHTLKLGIGGASSRQFLKTPLRNIWTKKTTCCRGSLVEGLPGQRQGLMRMRRGIGDHRPIADLEQLLVEHDPEVLIVILGANRTRIDKDIALLERLNPERQRVVFWVGTYPRFNQEEIDTQIRQALAMFPRFEHIFIPSADIRALKNPGRGSHHFDVPSSRAWSRVLLQRILPWLHDLCLLDLTPVGSS